MNGARSQNIFTLESYVIHIVRLLTIIISIKLCTEHSVHELVDITIVNFQLLVARAQLPSVARTQCLVIADVWTPDGPFRHCTLNNIYSAWGCYLFYHHSVVWPLALHSNSGKEKMKSERKVDLAAGAGGGGGLVTNWTFSTIFVTALHSHPHTERSKKVNTVNFSLDNKVTLS
jgi:hypothetical protein